MKVSRTLFTLALLALFNLATSGIVRSNGLPGKQIMAPNFNIANPLLAAQRGSQSMNMNPFGLPMTNYGGVNQAQMAQMQRMQQMQQMQSQQPVEISHVHTK